MAAPASPAPSVAVVEDESAIRALLVIWLEREGYAVRAFESGEAFVESLRTFLPDVIVLDLGLPGMSGFEVLAQCRAAHPYVPVVMLTGEERVELIVKAIREGASDYLLKPVTSTRLTTTVKNAVRHNELVQRVRELEGEGPGGVFAGIIGTSAPMSHLLAQLRHVAGTDVGVLIQGESGTGKELVARALHRASPRAAGPFVAINCAAIPETLQESELFGHERGAFTGADRRRIGRFEEANGGTLFLDEVGELSAGLQAKLLRVLQERTFRRVGGTADIVSDFRLVGATNRHLGEAVEEGAFREDLYYRIAVFSLTLPPLRDRGDDVLLIAHSLARDLGIQLRGEPFVIAPEAEELLRSYRWPGNVRELQNAIQRAIVVSSGRRLLPEAFGRLGGPGGGTGRGVRNGGGAAGAGPDGGAPPQVAMSEEELWDRATAGLTLDDIERRAIESALRRHGGNRTRVAAELRVSRTTLYRKLASE